MKKLLGFVAGIIVVALGCAGASSVHAAVDSMNYVNVSSCEQVGNDIRVSLNNGAKYFLTSSCRDAGYGMRQYKLNCTSPTQYKVEWSTPSSCTNSTPTHDVNAPSVSLTANNSTVGDNENVTLTATASDVYGVSKIEIYEGGVVRKTCTNTTVCTYSFTSDAYQSSERTQTFNAHAYDAAGNIGTSNSYTIRTKAITETNKPQVSLTVSKTAIKTGKKITLDATASDTSGIAKIELYQDGNRIKICTDVNNCSYTVTLKLSSTVNSKTYSFYARATDKNGNTQNSITKEVRVTR